MILLLALLATILIGLARGGKLSRVGDIPLRWGWMPVIAFAMQSYLIFHAPVEKFGGISGVREVAFVLSYLLLLIAVWKNHQLPGVKIIGLGLLLNLAVMAANGGLMPITPEALLRAGQEHLAPGLQSGIKVDDSKDIILSRDETRLWALSDIFVLSFPIRSVLSVGDILVAVGAFVLLQEAMLGRVKPKSPAD
ncbi:MAG: DUF5317 domain-containing protein [Chloroflexota bacterium]|nr:DUF5317 domain-containing protein [Chloroflexota bacterium]